MGGGSTTDSHSTSTTELPQWVQDAGQANYGVAQSLANAPNPYYQGNSTAGLTSSTWQAMGAADNNMNNTNNLMTNINGLLGSYAPSISASPVTAAQATSQGYTGQGYTGQGYTGQGYTGQGYTGAQVAPSGTVTAGQLAVTDLSPYMNPYTQNVVDRSMQQLNQQHDVTANANAANAAAAGAFGGSRAAVQQGVADSQTAQQAGLLSSQLYSQGYNNAQQAAVGDIDRRMSADTTNVANTNAVNQFNANSTNSANAFTANANNSAGAFNANAANSAGAFNANAANSADAFTAAANNSANAFTAGAANSASLANTAATNSMAQFNSSQDLAAREAQDQAMRSVYGLQLSGAAQQSSLNNTNATTLGQFGAAQQATNQARLTGNIAEYNQNAAYPQQQLGLLESALGMTPYNTTTQSDGTVTKSQSPDFASIGLGAMKMFNPFSSFM